MENSIFVIMASITFVLIIAALIIDFLVTNEMKRNMDKLGDFIKTNGPIESECIDDIDYKKPFFCKTGYEEEKPINKYELYFSYDSLKDAQQATNFLKCNAQSKDVLDFNDLCVSCGRSNIIEAGLTLLYMNCKWSSDDILSADNPIRQNSSDPNLWKVVIPTELNHFRLKELLKEQNKEEENKMNQNLFQKGVMIDKMKEAVVEYFNGRCDRTDNKKLTKDEVFVVWFNKTLQNAKAMISTTVSDGMYYELTYNGDKNEMYLDAYKKWENKCIKMED